MKTITYQYLEQKDIENIPSEVFEIIDKEIEKSWDGVESRIVKKDLINKLSPILTNLKKNLPIIKGIYQENSWCVCEEFSLIRFKTYIVFSSVYICDM